MNRKIIKMFILVTLLALLAGIASATDVSDDTDAGGITEEVSLQDTQMVSQTDTITKEANVNDNLQADESKIKKNKINKTNLKKAERYASSWDELTRKVSDATEDTTITLTEGTYTNTGTITLNKEYILTIDGNGQTINGDQKQVFFIASGSSLILKNITITNGRSYNGPIYNSGALTITHSTLYNNNANRFGGVIYNNAGVTTITNSTLNNNNAEYGGAIYNTNLGITSITNSTLNNNTATGQEFFAGGGAICTWHGNEIKIINSTLNNNNAVRGGAIFNWYNTVIITNSTLNNNHAHNSGGAIYSKGIVNITGNIFSNNTAGNEETIDFNETNYGMLNDNTYNNTNIALNMKLSVEDDKTIFVEGEEIALNINMGLEHPNYYDTNVLEQIGLNKSLNKTFYINGVENVTTKDENVILSDLEPGTYTVNYVVEFDMRNYTSNNVIFKVFSSNQINEMNVTNYTELINTIERAKIMGYNTLIINLLSGSYNATGNITWKDSDTKNIVINGNGLTLDGQNAYQFIQIASGHNLTLENITLTNYTAQYGGAIQNQGTLTITNSTLNNNHVYYNSKGGAIQNQGTLTITNSTLYNNNAFLFGGAIHNDQYGNIIITNTTLHNNTAGIGGAIYNDQYGNIIITNSTLHNNTADEGGAIYSRNGNTIITDSTLYNNTADVRGGAIYKDLGNTTITNSVFYNNNANEDGGAIYNDGVIFNITNNIFYNNTPTNFIINQDNHIQIKHNNHFISIGNFSIIVDDEKVFNGSGADDFNKYTLGDHYIKLILNGTGTNTSNNVFILRKSKTKNVNGYQELIDAIEEAKLEEYEKYIINLGSGNYNAIANIKLSDSATKNIIINGNGLTLNGKKEFQFIQIAEGYNLILENITIINYTAREGGVIYNNGNLSITDSTLENNQATETGDYGDVYAKGGVIYNNGNLIVTDSTLENNQATATITAALSIGQSGNAYSYGGAIYNNGNLIITNSTLENNQATAIEEDLGNAYSYGGAIYNNGNLIVTDSTLENNQATATGFSTTDAEGGAIFNWNGNTTIIRSTLHNNNANKWGGAIANDHGTAIIIQSTLYNNNATSGGAIYNYFGIYEVIHTIFYNNTPANFIINQYNHIQLEDSSGYITVGSFSIIVDDEKVFSGFGTDELNSYTISTNSPNVKLILNGTETNTINNIFILRSLNVRGYQELVDAIEEAKVKEYEKYIINLDSGDYTATCSIDWRDSATRNIIIKGNGLTLNGKNRYQFINIASGHNLVLENITITNYTAYEGGAISNGGTLTIKNSTLENNHGTYGGAIYNYNGGNLTVTDSNLTNNNATTGGAINNYNGNITLNNTTLTYNDATEYGGAIVNNGTRGNLTIIDSKLENNNANKDGGAIYNTQGNALIEGNTFITNTAGTSGYAIKDDSGSATIHDNINADTSTYSSTIYTDGSDVSILSNVFYELNTNINISSNNSNPSVFEVVNLTFLLKDQLGNPLANQIINITINDIKYNITTNDEGYNTLEYTIQANETIINAIYPGNDKYFSNTASLVMYAQKLGTQLLVDDVNAKVDEEFTINGTLNTKDNTPLKYATIKITVNDKTNTTTTNEIGQFNMTFTLDKMGKYPITVTYLGDKIYNQSINNTAKVTATKTDTKLTLNVSNTTAVNNTKINITIKLTDNNNNPIENQDINITINDEIITVKTNNNGTNTTEYTTSQIGSQTITATYHGNNMYNNNTTTTQIKVIKIDTKLTLKVSNTTPVNNTPITITAILTDTNNNKLANRNITFTINDRTYTTPTNNEAIATLNYTPTTPGKQTITATYNGDSQYNNSTAATSITVKKINTRIDLKVSNTTPVNNTPITITVTLKDTDGNKLAGQNITIIVAGKTFNVKTNANGVAIQSYTPVKVETQTITATYKGDSKYINSTVNTNITIKKINTKLSLQVSNTTPTNNTSITINVTLTDTNSNKLAGQNITITVGTKAYVLKTNAYGVATQSYTPTKVETQTITAKYNGDSQYNNSSTTASITVKKITTKLTLKVSNSTPVNNTSITITATLTDENNNKVANQNITITVGGKTFKVKTNSNGIATQSYTPTKVETQIIAVTYKGDSQYVNSTATANITVKKINSKLTVKASNTTLTLNTSINITAILTDANGNKLSGQNVTINVAGRTYTVKTDTSGVATKAYTPTTVGKQTITATYKGDSKYNNSTATTNITVNKINTKLTLKVSNTTPKVTDTITITATLTDAKGNKVAGQNVTLSVEDKRYTIKTNNNGIATQTHKLTKAQTTTITAKYNGNNNYNPSTTSTKVTVKENILNTSMTITVNNTKPRVNDNVMVAFTLKDEKNNPVKNQEIKVSMNGNNTTVKTNTNGVATTNYTVAKKDKLVNITATYNGNATLKATTGNLTIDRYYKVDMELLTGSFDSKPGQTVKLIAHIKDNGVDIDGGQLVFKLNGVSLKDENGSAVIVNIKNGLAVLEYKIPDTLGARTHNLTAVYASNTYGRVELTTPMTIGKYTTHIDVNPLYTTTDKITIKAQIVDQNNQALNKQTTISIKVNGKSYSLNTINGTIDYQISQTLKDGYYNITIISGENGKYLGANVKTVLIKSNSTIKTNYINNTLNKDTTAKSGDTKTSNIMSILTGASTVKPGDRLKLIAHLSEDQVDITGGQLVFKLNGVSLKDEQGNAVVVNINDGLGVLDYKIPDTLGARTHNLTAVYSSKQYGRVELTTQLTMNRLNTHIEAEPIYTSGSTSYIKAKILDDNNQLINKQTSVVIKVDGKSYAFNTTTGFIDYKVPNTLSKGLHQITIISGENGKYISSRANTVLIKT